MMVPGGGVLNDFLLQTHDAGGQLRAQSVGTSQLQDAAVTSSKLADDAVTSAKLSSDVRDQLGAVGSGGATNLSTTATTSTVTVASDTGIDATISAATTTLAGVLSADDKTKLDGIAANATKNQSDATLLDRANHTGSQAISTVTNLQSSLDAKAAATAVVTLTGSQTVAGVKTFSSAPVVPDNSFAQSKVTGLATTLSGKVNGQNGATDLWIGTQAQYDAISSKSNTTLYVISGS